MKTQSIILAIVVLLAAGASAAGYSGGDGSAENPYRIATAEDMNEIGANPDDWDAHFVMVNDINLAEYTGTQFNIIGNDSNPFTGVFDGNGHTISNFTYTCTTTDDIGLFSYIDDPNAEIKDLILTDPNVEAGYGENVGSLVGQLVNGTISSCGAEGSSPLGGYCIGGLVGENAGTISNCYVTSSFSVGLCKIGGLVGYNGGDIENCCSTGKVWAWGSRYSGVGGLVGYNSSSGGVENCYSAAEIWTTWGPGPGGGLVGDNYGCIENCYATGEVSGYGDYIGGLVGYHKSGTISNCYATGNVSGEKSIGGLVGENDGDIENCYSAGKVSGGDYYTGGLVGENTGTISNCYATGAVSGNFDTGGLVGHNWYGVVSNCYATGSVEGDLRTGGLVGHNEEGTVTASFWDIETTGQSTSAGGVGKTTAEMQTENTFTDADWDFVIETINGTENIWTIHEGVDYPKLVWKLVNFVGVLEVDFADYAFFAEHWMDTNCGASNDCDGCDIDFSDAVDMADLQIFCQHWLEGAWP